MDFAIDLHRDDYAAALRVLARVSQWNKPPGRNYWTGEADLDNPLLDGAARAFFIKMEPHTDVYRHRDPREVWENFNTDHIVVSTNDQSFICWEDHLGIAHRQHLDLGKRYRIVDRGLLHWAVNDGDTDRIHLLIEYPK
jgi:hypothetical protein